MIVRIVVKISVSQQNYSNILTRTGAMTIKFILNLQFINVICQAFILTFIVFVWVDQRKFLCCMDHTALLAVLYEHAARFGRKLF